MIKKLGSIGNGRLWMALLQKRLLGEKSTGPNPTDRAKSGTKRSILVDGKGVPLGVCVDGANRHDMKMTKATLQSIVIYRPEPTIRSKRHMCMDKGYAFPEVYELLEEYGYTIHIRLKGKERSSIKEGIPKYRARRWVVERTHSWMNRFRRLLVRWEKRIENYIGIYILHMHGSPIEEVDFSHRLLVLIGEYTLPYQSTGKPSYPKWENCQDQN